MPLQDPFRFEHLLAEFTLECVLRGVRRHVVPPVARRSELFIAARHGTSERPLVRVRPDVYGEVGLLDEGLGTHRADVAPIGVVVLCVHFEGGFGVE